VNPVAFAALAALVLGWPVASTNSGKLYLRIGFRNTMIIGTVIVIIGTWLSSRLGSTSSIWEVAFACFIVGMGVGLSVTPGLVMVQSMVNWHRRGIVTSTNLFSRSMGSAVGAAIFGAIANGSISRHLSHIPAGLTLSKPVNVDSLNLALTQSGGGSKTKDFAQGAIFQATHDVLQASILVAVVILLAIAFLPGIVKPLDPVDSQAA
jgi:MFS family permease